MNTGARVKLSWYEAAIGSYVGMLRQLASLKRGLQQCAGHEGASWNVHLEGASGEMAVAKHLNVYWGGGINTFKDDDLPGLQIRLRTRHDHDLILRKQDSERAIWVLITGTSPDFWIRGWIYGHEAKKPEWLQKYGKDRSEGYVVRVEYLHPIETLPGYQKSQKAASCDSPEPRDASSDSSQP
jgi:hypothetical protein